ncbi:MAG: ATP synthase F1 subunit gamma [Desulfatibacillum sp.]|nr:ATP synthase F1 subunit gamma [Desulfatibacillum sp.]
MPSLKDVQNKISGVKKTRQITKAMNMVAASRLRGAQLKMEAFRPYADKFGQVLGSLAERAGEDASPLLTPKDKVKKILLVLCTSDRGLCGGFNFNLIQKAQNYMAGLESDVAVDMVNFGKRGRDWARKEGLNRVQEHIGIVGARFGFNVASDSGAFFIKGFLEGEYDEVHIIYSQFISMGKQVPVLQQLVPIPPIEVEGTVEEDGQEYLPEHICEPSADALLADLLPRNVYVQIYKALLETSTSEQAARMTAMDNATKACNDMLDELTLLYNKARQSAVTTELMDIVGGAEALKG